MKKILFGLLPVFLLCVSFSSGPGKEFPAFKGITLSGKSVTLPDTKKKQFTLVGCAWSTEAQDALYTWAQPIYSSIVDNPMYPVGVYFVAMTGKIKVMSQEKIKAKIKENVDQDLRQYVIVYPEDPQKYIDALDMQDKKLPYLFVIDPEGNISYSTSGEYTAEKFEKITDALSE